MEVQLTDFENAAFAVFSVLVTRVVLAFDLSLYVPLSRVDANMRRAQRRDAATTERFYFRRQLAPDSDEAPSKFDNCCGGSDDDVFEEMTCQEIIDGKGARAARSRALAAAPRPVRGSSLARRRRRRRRGPRKASAVNRRETIFLPRRRLLPGPRAAGLRVPGPHRLRPRHVQAHSERSRCGRACGA